jgi:hypothetical protein
VLVNVCRLPGVADPHIADRPGRLVSIAVRHVLGQGALLYLVLVLRTRSVNMESANEAESRWLGRSTHMKHEYAKLCLLVAPKTLARNLDILLELSDGILERGAGVVDLVND